MKAKQKSSLRRVLCPRALITLGIIVLFSCSQKALAQQWNTNGNDISNANSGNVGVGTIAPGAKLDVAGVTRSQAFNLGGVTAEKAFSVLWNNGVANQKVQIYWPANTQVDGIFEITVTGHYWFSNSNGGIRKRIVINGRNIGIINMQQSEVPFRLGFTGNSNTISNIMWDSTNSRYYFIVANLDNAQNGITIHVKSITPGPITATADNLTITPIYTTDATAYPQLFNSFMSGNVGVGTNTPGFKLDVQGGQINASGGLCIAGDCKTAWSQVGGGGSSQWTTSGSSIYYNTGSVGIGITSPLYSLDVNGGANGFRSKTSTASASDAIATFENPGGIQAIMRGNGNLGLGSINPAVRLAINGNGVNVYNTDAWLENNMHVQGNETLAQGGRGRLRIGTAWGYMGLYSETSSTGVQNDLVLGAGSGNVRVGPGGGIVQSFVVPNGNVGIGTSTPTQRLEVNGNAVIGTIFGSSAAGGTLTLQSTSHTTKGTIQIGVDQTTTTSIGQSGTPGNKLIVASDRLIVNNAGVRVNGAPDHGDLSVTKVNITNPDALQFRTTSPIITSNGSMSFNVNNINGDNVRFNVQNSVISNAFVIDSNTATPARLFDVRDFGNSRFTVTGAGNVGVGTPAPGFKVDVQGGQINASGGLCIAGDCKTAWSQVGGGGGSSQWTTAGTAIHYNSGNVGIGTPAPAKTLDVVGDINATGTITGGNIIAKYQDLAEWVPATRALPPGTVVTLNLTQSNLVEASSKAYDTRVAGVISLQPGIALGERSENKVLVATTGRVRIKVDAANGPIQIGDLLVTSDQEGFAMKSEAVNVGGVSIHRPGTIIGKALEPLASGRGEILVLLSLQ